MRILFMGTPEFAVPSLDMLQAAGEEIVAVVTQPDRPAGRGHTIAPPPVKVRALEQGLRVLQPESLKDDRTFHELAATHPDLLVVVAYGQILPRRILELPAVAPLNVHASLLPGYRGAAPINWAIIRGETRTGITIMRIIPKLDAGDILIQCPENIRIDDTAGSLHDRLMERGATCLQEALDLIRNGDASFRPQDDSQVSYAPMLTREMARIDWSLPATECHNFIRGLNPWPTAWTTFRGSTCKVLRTELSPSGTTEPGATSGPGTLRPSGSRLLVACGNGTWLQVLRVLLPGRGPVSGAEFANGARLSRGDRFE